MAVTARTDVRADGLFLICFGTAFLAPQFIRAIPGLPDYARFVDFGSALLLAAYVLLRLARRGATDRLERVLLLFLFAALIGSAGGGLFLLMSPQHNGALGLEQVLYPIRHLFLFAPALLAFAIAIPSRSFPAIGVVTFALAALFIVFMTLAYRAGFDWYDAHQGLIDLSRKTGYFKRMGGIPGEAGAYAFHALFVAVALIAFCFLARLTTAGYVLLAATPLWVLMVFSTSQTRIVLVTAVIFWAACLLDRRVFPRMTAALVAAGVGSAACAALAAFTVLGFRLPVDHFILLRFRAILSGRVDADALSSGRIAHWRDMIELWMHNPVLGYGYRNATFIEGTAVENFFLQGFVEYGVFVFACLCVLLVGLFARIHRIGAGNAPAHVARAAGVLQAMMIASMFQWQVNDLNTYWQTFPMFLALIVMVAKHAGDAGGMPARAAQPSPSAAPAGGAAEPA